MNLGLGTVQFGLDYGISNTAGQTSEAEAKAIVQHFIQAGCHTLDTSLLYGQSESVLGKILPHDSRLRICSKISLDENLHGSVNQQVDLSLSNLQRSQIYAYMAHHSAPLFTQAGYRQFEQLDKLKQAGVISKIGVSVYDPLELEQVLAICQPDLIQLPLNWLDLRFLQTGWLKRLKQLDIEVHCRSIFLQGVLLTDPSKLPAAVAPLQSHLHAYHQHISALGLTPLAAALAITQYATDADIFVLGCCDPAQAQQLLAAYQTIEKHPVDLSEFAHQQAQLIDPRTWARH